MFSCAWLRGEGAESDRPDLLGVIVIHEKMSLGKKNLVLVHLWEYRDGSLVSDRIGAMTENAIEYGNIVVPHYIVSDDEYAFEIYAPKGLLSEQDLQELEDHLQ